MPVEQPGSDTHTQTHTQLLLDVSGLGPVLAGLSFHQTGFTFGKQPVIAERYVHAFSLRAVGFPHRML